MSIDDTFDSFVLNVDRSMPCLDDERIFCIHVPKGYNLDVVCRWQVFASVGFGKDLANCWHEAANFSFKYLLAVRHGFGKVLNRVISLGGSKNEDWSCVASLHCT